MAGSSSDTILFDRILQELNLAKEDVRLVSRHFNTLTPKNLHFGKPTL